MKIMALNGQLGYGFTALAFEEGLRRGPDVIGVDGGSTDGGPFYLGQGKPMVSRTAVHRDLSLALPAAVRRGIPLIIGSAGTGGGRPHLDWTREIIEEIAAREGLSFKLAVIQAEIAPEVILQALESGRVRPLDPAIPALTPDAVRGAARIVGQMGIGPFMKALDLGADVILAGRSCDTAIFASPAIRAGFDHALAFHMAKVAECGTHCSVEGIGADCLWVEMAPDQFTLEPLNPNKRCTPVSVAAHSLYEQANPYQMFEPEGMLDLSAARFEAVSDRKVRVSGSRFVPAAGHSTIKLEGSTRVGYRTITIAGARDPIFISQIDSITDHVRHLITANLNGRVEPDQWSLSFRVYGRDGVMGEREPERDRISHELGIVIEVLAESQEIADAVCALARSTMLHTEYPGRKTTAGNLALPYSPADLSMGPVYEFSLYHLMEVDDPTALFPIEIVAIGGGGGG